MSKVSQSPSSKNSNSLLSHRKVFMITEKTADDKTANGRQNSNNANGHKRKMILIMDEKPQTPQQQQQREREREQKQQQQQQQSHSNGTKIIKVEKDEYSVATKNGTPKLLFFADSVDNQLSQKIEEILPEILNRVQWKNGRVIDMNDGNKILNKNINFESTKLKQGSIFNNRNNSNNTNSNQNEVKANSITNGIQLRSDNTPNGNTVNIKNINKELINIKKEFSLSNNHNNCNNSNLMLLGAAAAATAANAAKTQSNHVTEISRKITLPPKKNLSKLQKQLHNSNFDNESSVADNITDSNEKMEVISAATTVIRHSAITFNKLTQKNHLNALKQHPYQQQQKQQQQHQTLHHQQQQQQCQQQEKNQESNEQNGNNNSLIHFTNGSDSNISTDSNNSIVVQQQNINLTGDFLFLMKMLPLLERTSEPRKTQVKMLIEKIMNQCADSEEEK